MAEKKRNMGGYGIPLTNDDDHENNSRLTFKRAKLVSNGKATQMFLEEEDRLSSLPDSLLLHILSYIYWLKETSRTCVLSKRWQFLWLDLPEFNFCERGRCVVDWVDKTLSLCSGIHLKKFRVIFTYRDFLASSVDLWLQFVTKNKVKSVVLDFDRSNCKKNELYKLPQMMYSNSSLTNLSLRRCIIAPLGGTMVEWKSLKSLSFREVELSGFVVGSILSGCPVLDYLWLFKCWGTKCLDIKSRSLRRLVIGTWKGDSLEIFAPFIHILEITAGSYEEEYCREFRLMGISSSLVKARLYDTNDNLYRYDEASTHKLMDCMKQLLGNLRHVLELSLGPWFIEVLSVLVVKWGWRLPQYSCKHLAIQAFTQSRRSIPSILGILESSPNLETLVITGLHVEEFFP